jgi:glucokinase
MILVADVGGTNTRFALMSVDDGALEPVAEETFPSGGFAGLGDAVGAFIDLHPGARGCRRACLGVPGPIRRRQTRCAITNLPWVVDAVELARDFHLDSVTLLNDVEAAAWGLAVVGPRSVRTVWEGAAGAAGNLCLLSAGTGLGEAALVSDGDRHLVMATEGGHADFAPADELQVELWRHLHRRHGHVSWERVVAGPGLVAIHGFLLERRGEQVPDWLAHELAEGDAAAAITARAKDRRCGACVEAVELFFALLGAEAGNLALHTLALGGVYLAGGIVPRLLAELAVSRFHAAFTAKGRFAELLETIPIRVVTDRRLALWGAAAAAAELDGTRLRPDQTRLGGAA